VAPNKGSRTRLLAREVELRGLPWSVVVAREKGPVVDCAFASPYQLAVETRGS
jgi:hypothetical protein